MRVVLVRHGELQENWQPDTGHLDPALSARGLHDAEAIALALVQAVRGESSFAALYSSPLAAARETAEVIGAALDLSPEIEPSLATLTPEVLSAGDLAPLEVMGERCWALLQQLKERLPEEGSVVLCTHELPIRALVCRALGMAAADYRTFAVDPGSLTTIEFRGARTLLAGLNETCHLDEARGSTQRGL